MQDKRILQQQLSSESAARTAAEQQVQALQRQLSTATADCTNCKEVPLITTPLNSGRDPSIDMYS